MAVELTSPVLGQDVGYVYTGDLEAWLLAEGYAKQDGYTGPGVSNTGATDVDPSEDPTNAENREAPQWPAGQVKNATIANDADNLTKAKFPNPDYDFDEAGVDTEAVVVTGLEPESGALAGGDVVRIYADNVEGTTGVTFGGVAGTDLEVNEDAGYLDVTTPAGAAAGAVDVVVTDDVGSDTVTGGFTYDEAPA